MTHYRELEVWRHAMDLARGVYAYAGTLPVEERFALCDQMRRSSVSIPSNIAEGFGRDTTSDFIRFLFMARGSLFELDTQLELAQSVGHKPPDDSLRAEVIVIGKMLNALIAKLRTRRAGRQPPTADYQPPTTNH